MNHKNYFIDEDDWSIKNEQKKFMDQNGFYNDSEDHHQDIIEQLKKGNSQAAIQAVKRNWMQILNFES